MLALSMCVYVCASLFVFALSWSWKFEVLATFIFIYLPPKWKCTSLKV